MPYLSSKVVYLLSVRLFVDLCVSTLEKQVLSLYSLSVPFRCMGLFLGRAYVSKGGRGGGNFWMEICVLEMFVFVFVWNTVTEFFGAHKNNTW